MDGCTSKGLSNIPNTQILCTPVASLIVLRLDFTHTHTHTHIHTHTHSSMYFDEDGDLAHEFYCEERRRTRSGKVSWHMRKIVDHLRPQVPSLVLYSVLWYTVVYCGILWYTVVYCVTLWYTVAYCGILWYTVVHCGTLWHTVAYCGILWYTVVYCGIL